MEKGKYNILNFKLYYIIQGIKMTDIEIARSTKLQKIVDIAKKVEIDEEDIEQYGKYKAIP